MDLGACQLPVFSAGPAGCQLPGAERATAATAEETDIDAVEVPLPGADGLDFSRGVTDLDAVGKDGGSHTDSTVGRAAPDTGCHEAPSGIRAYAGGEAPGPLTLDWK